MGSKHIILASFVLAMATTGSTAYAFNSDLTSENREQLRERFEEPWFDRRDVSHEERRACQHYKKHGYSRHSHGYEHEHGHKHKHKRVHRHKQKQISEPTRMKHVERQQAPASSSQPTVQSPRKGNR